MYDQTTKRWTEGDRVAYLADPRVTGTVVGIGHVNNDADENASGDGVHAVTIVRLDVAAMHPIAHLLVTHMPFANGTLCALVGE